MERRSWPLPFTSALTKGEAILVLLYLPVHLVVLQLLFSWLLLRGLVSPAEGDFLYYLTGVLYMLAVAFRFLRRDFDPLVDHPFLCLREVLGGYCAMYVCNFLLAMLLLAVLPEAQNPNNTSVMAVVEQESGLMRATLIFLAPVTEEMLFRAGLFGLLRRRNRATAYIVSALGFSLYHVLPYAILQPVYWVFLLQYIPVSLLLARCYERSNSIWCSIAFHSLVNTLALYSLS